MMPRRPGLYAVILLWLGVVLSPPLWALAEFSADLIYYDADDQEVARGRLYVSDDAVREERSRGKEREVRITDHFRGVTTVIDPVRERYYQTERSALPRNPARFCEQMMLLECGYQKDEEIDGVAVERWGAELGLPGISLQLLAWYSPQLHYPVMVELEGSGRRRLSNIQLGRIPSSLFVIPFRAEPVEPFEGVKLVPLVGW